MAYRRASIINFISKRMKSAEAPAARYISPTSELGEMNHRVSRLEQHMLVWNGRYRHIADVPLFVSRDVMERARNMFRIRLNLSIAAATILISFIMVISGKNAAQRGETVQKQNQDWHRQYNADH